MHASKLPSLDQRKIVGRSINFLLITDFAFREGKERICSCIGTPKLRCGFVGSGISGGGPCVGLSSKGNGGSVVLVEFGSVNEIGTLRTEETSGVSALLCTSTLEKLALVWRGEREERTTDVP